MLSEKLVQRDSFSKSLRVSKEHLFAEGSDSTVTSVRRKSQLQSSKENQDPTETKVEKDKKMINIAKGHILMQNGYSAKKQRRSSWENNANALSPNVINRVRYGSNIKQTPKFSDGIMLGMSPKKSEKLSQANSMPYNEQRITMISEMLTTRQNFKMEMVRET